MTKTTKWEGKTTSLVGVLGGVIEYVYYWQVVAKGQEEFVSAWYSDVWGPIDDMGMPHFANHKTHATFGEAMERLKVEIEAQLAKEVEYDQYAHIKDYDTGM